MAPSVQTGGQADDAAQTQRLAHPMACRRRKPVRKGDMGGLTLRAQGGGAGTVAVMVEVEAG